MTNASAHRLREYARKPGIPLSRTKGSDHRYAERDLIEVATEIFHNPEFRRDALRFLNREGRK